MLGIEPHEQAIDFAQKRVQDRGFSIPTTFVNSLITTDVLSDNYQHKDVLEEGTFDVCCAFNGLDECLAEESTMRVMMRNVASLLKPGGYFFGIMHDSAEIWSLAQKSRVIPAQYLPQSGFFSLQFYQPNYEHTGTVYTYNLDGVRPLAQYLIHIPTLRSIAKDEGLELVSCVNCTEFFEDNRIHYASMLYSLGVLEKSGVLFGDQREVISLYTTFVFQKRRAIKPAQM